MPPVLDYSPPIRRPIRWRRWLTITGILMGLCALVMLVLSSPYRIRTQRVCQECGVIHVDIHYYWGLGFLDSSYDNPTAVSEVVKTSGHLRAHAHLGTFLNDNEYYPLGGRSCGLGSGGVVYRNTTSLTAAVLLDRLYRSGQKALAEDWRARLLDKTTAMKAGAELDALALPLEPFTNPRDFDAWQKTHMPAGGVKQ